MPNPFEIEEVAAGALKLAAGRGKEGLVEEAAAIMSGGEKQGLKLFGRFPVSLSRPDELVAIRDQMSAKIAEVDAKLVAGNKPMDLFDPAMRKQFVPLKFAEGELKMAPSANGKAEIIFDSKNGVQKLTFTPEMTLEQRKQQMLIGSFANLLKSDPDAIEAVSTIHGKSLGLIQSHTVRLATDEQMQSAAASGAQSFIRSEEGNGYSKFLRSAFGPWTPEDTGTYFHLTNPYGGISGFDESFAARGLAQSEQHIPGFSESVPLAPFQSAADSSLLDSIRQGAGGLPKGTQVVGASVRGSVLRDPSGIDFSKLKGP